MCSAHAEHHPGTLQIALQPSPVVVVIAQTEAQEHAEAVL
eukprot:SAG25_NODE_9108_length_387_cov_1.083333_2_plen_39_part_01